MKKKKTAVAGAILAIVLIIVSFLDPGFDLQDLIGEDKEVNTIFRISTDSPIKVPDIEGIMPSGFVQARVTRIVDGDTLEVEHDKEEYKVRLLCVDTPETKKSGVEVQPYGKQAAEKLTEMVLDKHVALVFEKDVDDRYDRLLAYIFTAEGICVNAALVEQGYARVDIVRPNNVHEDYFYKLQDKAIKEKKGLWSLPESKRPFIKNDRGYYVPRYIDDAA